MTIDDCLFGCTEKRIRFVESVNKTLAKELRLAWPMGSITIDHIVLTKNESMDKVKRASEYNTSSPSFEEGSSLYYTSINDRLVKGDSKKLYMTALTRIDRMTEMAEEWILAFINEYRYQAKNSTILSLFVKSASKHYLELMLGQPLDNLPENVWFYFTNQLSLPKDKFSEAIRDGLEFDCVWKYLTEAIDDVSRCGMACSWIRFGMKREDAVRNIIQSIYPFSNVISLFSKLLNQYASPKISTGGLSYHKLYKNPTLTQLQRTYLTREVFRIENPADRWISYFKKNDTIAFYDTTEILNTVFEHSNLLNLELHSNYAIANNPAFKNWKEEEEEEGGTFGSLLFYKSITDNETLWLYQPFGFPPEVHASPVYPPFGFGSRRCPMEEYSERVLNIMLSSLEPVFKDVSQHFKRTRHPFILVDHDPLVDYE